jgi:hypothetical protein
MLEFVERTEAAHEGRKPEPVAEVLNLMRDRGRLLPERERCPGSWRS